MRLRPPAHPTRRRAAAAVEFAVVVPVLLMFLFGIVEYGRLLMAAQITTNATTDSTPANDRSTSHTTVHTSADLSIHKDGPTDATAGDPAGFDYTLTVTNNGPSDNTGGFTITDALPAGTTFHAAGSDLRCSATGQSLSCSNSTGLASGDSDSFWKPRRAFIWEAEKEPEPTKPKESPKDTRLGAVRNIPTESATIAV